MVYFVQYSTCLWVDRAVGTRLYVREDSQTCLSQVRIDSVAVEVEFLGSISETAAELGLETKETLLVQTVSG